ncbi:MAG: hypothetical protein R2780_05210 [Crocinitomicaceae bacterium]|nr:hypothetical protein [Crocinitomicaceae bacterium]
MKKIVLFFIVPLSCFAQEKVKYAIESIDVSIGSQALYQIDEGYTQFNNFTNDQDFLNLKNGEVFSDDISYNLSTRFTFFNLSIGIHSPEKVLSFNAGFRFDSRINNLFILGKRTRTAIDTLYSGTVMDTTIIDSVCLNRTSFYSRPLNVFGFAEMLAEFTIKRWTFQGGLGLGYGYSLKNYLERVDEFQFTYEQTPLAQYWNVKDNNFPNDGYDYQERSSRLISGNSVSTLQSYIPFYISFRIRDKGLFSKLGVLANANIGNELQFSRGTKPKGRFFWSYKFGLKFYI